MPEGDTVWRTALHLDQALTGAVLTETDFRVPAHATLDLAGERVEATVARGKHLLTRIGERPHAAHPPEDGGRLAPVQAGDPLAATGARGAGGAPHRRLERRRLRARRRRGDRRATARTPSWATSVRTCSAPTGTRTRRCGGCCADPDRPVADALLDQRNLAGIGNLYKNELCFLAGVHPRLPVGDVPDLPRLVRRARPALEANKERVAQTMTGDTRRGQQTWVYRRDKPPCRRCGTRIRVDDAGTRDAGAGDVLVPRLPARAGLSPTPRSGGGGDDVAGTGPASGRAVRRLVASTVTSSSCMARAASSSATASLTSERISDSGTSRAEQMEASSSDDASF